jgi:hypothetical protein
MKTQKRREFSAADLAAAKQRVLVGGAAINFSLKERGFDAVVLAEMERNAFSFVKRNGKEKQQKSA